MINQRLQKPFEYHWFNELYKLCTIKSWIMRNPLNISISSIGGFSGACPVHAPPKGPDSFVLTYKICEM